MRISAIFWSIVNIDDVSSIDLLDRVDDNLEERRDGPTNNSTPRANGTLKRTIEHRRVRVDTID